MKARFVENVAVSLFFLLSSSCLDAQPGSLDISFNPGTGPNSTVTCLALETNGQIVVGGNFTSFNGSSMSRIGRLNADGSIDATFSPGVGPNGQIFSTLAQPDGKILVCGNYTYINGLPWNQPARFRTDGSLDLSFDTSAADSGGAPADQVMELALQQDGKVLLAGGTITISNIQFGGIARLETNAVLDEEFNTGIGITNGLVAAIGLQSTGKIIIGGSFTSFDGVSCNYIARLNTDGSLDSSFSSGLQDGAVSTPQ